MELAIRTAMLRLGGMLLEGLLMLDADTGPRVDCGDGHQAELGSYRVKTTNTVIGPARLRRAWYHCTPCQHGLAHPGAQNSGWRERPCRQGWPA